MERPTIESIRNLGYRMSANAGEELVARCAAAVLRDYLLHYVTTEDIEEAAADSALARAWASLTFVKVMQQTEFATRTGGERKRLEYGEHLTWMRAAKADTATALKEVAATFPRKSEVVDSCEIYFRNQILH